MKTIELFPIAGSFAENKDIARDIRLKQALPALEDGTDIVFDFGKVESATQSFIHALISDLIRVKGVEVIDKISFKNCSDTVKKIITIVVEYMQERD